MPRVKLSRFKVREPAPEALAAYLIHYPSRALHFHPETLPPIASPTLFGDDRPLVLDLGCGRGRFIIERAQQDPARNYAGVDFHQKSLWDAVNKAHAVDLPNVRFLRGDLRRLLKLAPTGSIVEAFMLFPPPYLKPSRRHMDPLPDEALREIARMLVEGAPFHFVTDSPEYFDAKRTLIEASGWFEIVTTSVGFEGGQTRFQAFWERLNVESRRLEARRTGVAAMP